MLTSRMHVMLDLFPVLGGPVYKCLEPGDVLVCMKWGSKQMQKCQQAYRASGDLYCPENGNYDRAIVSSDTCFFVSNQEEIEEPNVYELSISENETADGLAKESMLKALFPVVFLDCQLQFLIYAHFIY
ncbi:unnamed protein product [Prunus brigantina]